MKVGLSHDVGQGAECLLVPVETAQWSIGKKDEATYRRSAYRCETGSRS